MCKKISFIFLLGLFLPFTIVQAQEEKPTLTPEETSFFKQQEDSLSLLFTMASTQDFKVNRLQKNNEFIPKLVELLKTPNSFLYPFENIEGFSTLYAPDNSFKIFTWVMPLSDETEIITESGKKRQAKYKFYGAVQFNDLNDLKLVPLLDKSDEMSNPEDLALTHDNWYGVIYYNIIMNEFNGEKYYTLFGWDANNTTSTKKVTDILYITPDNKVTFGAPIFEVVRENKKAMKHRFILEFKKSSGVTLNFEESRDMIIYDFIQPEQPEAKGNYHLYIPDGTYEGFKFEEGIWKHQAKVYHEVSSAPMQIKNSQNYNNDLPKKKKKRRKLFKRKKRKKRN